MGQMNLSIKQKQAHRHRKQTSGCQGEGWEGEGWSGSVGLLDAHYLEWVNKKILLYSTGNSMQSPGVNHSGKEYKKEHICVYNWVT